MKKLTLIFSLLIALIGFNANAAMYIVGNNPFGNWHTYAGEEMTDNGNGVYTYVTDQIGGTVWFVFADALTPGPGDDWNTFNGNYRYGPLTSGQQVNPGVEYTTQKSTNGNVSYNFAGTLGEPYQFTFDTNTMTFKVEGYVEPIILTEYSVAGTPASIFGVEWSDTNTETDMTLVDGLYTWVKNGVEITGGTNIQFKIVGNHDWGYAWPDENYSVDINDSGTYNLTFTFNADTHEVGFNAEKVQDGPEVDPITGDLFILGQVNGNNWNPSTGIEMATLDEDVYTLTDATFSDSGDGYAWFSFTSKLGENAEDWGFAPYRRGAMEDGTLVEDGVNAVLADWGTSYAFKVLPGTYDVEVGLSSDYVKLTLKDTPEPVVDDIYVFGDLNNYAWDPTQGLQMTYNEGIYTAEVNATMRDGEEKAYIGFTKKLADPESETPWDDIAGFRFGPVSEGAFVMTEELLGVECDLATDGSYESIALPEGTWTVSVDMENHKFTVNGTWPTDTVTPPVTEDIYVFGDLNNYAWDPTQGVLMNFNEGIYTAEVNATKREGEQKAYIGFTKKLADPESETPWDDIAAYRFGPVSEGAFEMTEELLGIECDLATDGSYESIALPEGTWTVSVDMVNHKFTVNGTWPTDTVTPPVEMVYTVVGPESIFGTNWAPADENNDMVLTDGVYTWTKENVTLYGNFQFKIVGNHDYAVYEWPLYPNNWEAVVAEEGVYTIVITFDPEAEENERIDCVLTKTGDVEPIEHVYTVAGTENLFGSNWNPEDEANNMVKGEDGVYTWTKNGVEFAAGEVVEFKVVQDHSWDYAWPSSNWYFEADEAGIYNVVITFDPNAEDMYKVNFTATLAPAYLRGDVDMDEVVGIGDVSALIDYLLNHDASNISVEAADCDLDEVVGIGDVSALIDYLLSHEWKD